MNAVAMNGLTKAYAGGKLAVDAVSLTLEPGEVFGFLGPNGLRYKLKNLSSISLR